MALRIRALAGLLLFSGSVFIACDGHPGGTVGDPCDDVGSSDQCASDEICDEIDGGAYCLLICSDHADCASSERCNGVTSSDIKACHPDDDGFDDDCEDCGDGGKNKDPF
jgi:hypothetical protein